MVAYLTSHKMARLAHSLFISVFDIDKGSVLKHRFPANALDNISDDWFAENQLPGEYEIPYT